MGSVHLKMVRAVQLLLLCLVSKDISAEPSPDPLDTVNVHLHLGEIEKAAAMTEKEGGGADYSGPSGSDYGYHPCAVPPCCEVPPCCAVPPCKQDDGDTINNGDNCAGVTCTGKRSAINIKCCGNDYAAKAEEEPEEKGSDYSIDDGNTINSGDNCKGVICTGKRSGINIKCCGNDYAAKADEDGAEESESAGDTGKKGSDYGYHPIPCASPPCKIDDGDTNNSGNNCAGVTCTGKRSGINIKCCGDDFRKMRMKKRKRRN